MSLPILLDLKTTWKQMISKGSRDLAATEVALKRRRTIVRQDEIPYEAFARAFDVGERRHVRRKRGGDVDPAVARLHRERPRERFGKCHRNSAIVRRDFQAEWVRFLRVLPVRENRVRND